jgi:Family of unknown function (DUF5329)
LNHVRSSDSRVGGRCFARLPLCGLAVLLLAALISYAYAQNRPDSEARKIEYLIQQVQSLSDAQFVRNGEVYGPQEAADHLRTKWHIAGSRIRTAEDFIRECASSSSVSGIAYTIRFADGHVISSAEFLRDKLAGYQQTTTP